MLKYAMNIMRIIRSSKRIVATVIAATANGLSGVSGVS